MSAPAHARNFTTWSHHAAVAALAALALSATACTSPYSAEYLGPKPAPSPLVNWPVATANRSVAHPIWITGEYDGKLTRYYGVDDLGTSSQDENQEPLFLLADGAVLSNVILGQPAADGIHCRGSCTLRNVWWERVGEDAATFRGKTEDDVMLVDGGGASGAVDKVFQSNGRGTMIIRNFYVESFGKLYRSCGNCSAQSKRTVIIENVTAIAGPTTASLVGVNVNYGDVAEFRGKSIFYDPKEKPICLKYEGNAIGSEPIKLGSGADGASCKYSPANIEVKSRYEGPGAGAASAATH